MWQAHLRPQRKHTQPSVYTDPAAAARSTRILLLVISTESLASSSTPATIARSTAEIRPLRQIRRSQDHRTRFAQLRHDWTFSRGSATQQCEGSRGGLKRLVRDDIVLD